MSDLETEARPLLTPLILGRPEGLNVPAQRVIAAWTVKTAMMFQFTLPPAKAVPAEQYRWFYEHRRPPPSSHIWVAGYSGPHVASYRHHGFRMESPSRPVAPDMVNGYSATLSIGQLVLHWFNHTLSGDFVLGSRGEGIENLGRIWPTTGGLVVWPPKGRRINTPTLRALADSFIRPASTRRHA